MTNAGTQIAKCWSDKLSLTESLAYLAEAVDLGQRDSPSSIAKIPIVPCRQARKLAARRIINLMR